MKANRKHARRRVVHISIEAVIAASGALSTMHASLTEQGYTVASGRLYPCRDGSYTARVVWRRRPGDISMVGSVQGLVL